MWCYHYFLLFLTLLLLSKSDESPSVLLCELRTEPVGIETRQPWFTWASPQTTTHQVAYQLRVTTKSPTGEIEIWNSGTVPSSDQQCLYTGRPLMPHTVYSWTVRTVDHIATDPSPWAKVQRFSTGVWNPWKARPIWMNQTIRDDPNLAPGLRDPQYVYFRSTISFSSPSSTFVQWALLYITADPPNKLLSAYRLYLNGDILGVGPGRNVCNEEFKYCKPISQTYDSYDITNILTRSSLRNLTLAVQCFGTQSNGQLLVQMHIHLSNGSEWILGTGLQPWRVFNATPIYSPVGSSGTQYYQQPHEFIDARLLLGGNSIVKWRLATFDDSTWPFAIIVKDFLYPLLSKITAPVNVTHEKAAHIVQLGPNHFYFEMQKEIQGGLQIFIPDGKSGYTLTLRLGEELINKTSKSIMYQMRTGNLYQDIWTLRNGPQFLEHHEYMEFRYGQILYSPPKAHMCAQKNEQAEHIYLKCPTTYGVISKITFASYGLPQGICFTNGTNNFTINPKCHANYSKGAVEHICLGKHLCEVPGSLPGENPCRGFAKTIAVAMTCNETVQHDITVMEQRSYTFTQPDIGAWVVRYEFDDNTSGQFSSSSDELNQVFEFCKYTIKATNLDMWTDSNSRQRDVLCNEANGVVTLMEYAVALEFSSQRWSSQYILNSGHAEHSFAEWQPISVGYAWNDMMYTGNLTVVLQYYDLLANYTLQHLINHSVGLVNVSTLPNPEIDWPKGMRDGFVFTDYDTVVNAYSARAMFQMADMAEWLNRTTDVAYFTKLGEQLKQKLNILNYNGSVFCDGRCSDTSHTAWHSSVFMLAFGLVDDDKIESTWNYARSRLYLSQPDITNTDDIVDDSSESHSPKPSDGMPGNVYMGQFILDALYRNDSDHGVSGLLLMLSTATDTWRAQMAQGATTTMEAWKPGEKPNLTWSHPWSASPADIIPRWLVGITPLQPGFSHIQIKPQLGTLLHAKYSLPTIRGSIHCDVKQSNVSTESVNMTIKLILPGNVQAKVFVRRNKQNKMCVDGKVVSASHTASYLYFDGLLAGSHTITNAC